VHTKSATDRTIALTRKQNPGGIAPLLGRLMLGMAATVTVGSAALIAVEQRHQTVEARNSACYSRAAAAAAIAATEISTIGSSKANPQMKFTECDRMAGKTP
jgi:hypothetical protein